MRGETVPVLHHLPLAVDARLLPAPGATGEDEAAVRGSVSSHAYRSRPALTTNCHSEGNDAPVKSRHHVAVLAATILVAAGGCSTSSGHNGPLSAGDESSSTCGPGVGESVFTFGPDWLTNDSDDPVTITGVELIDPENMELVEAILLPEPEPPMRMSIGLVDGYPPTDYTDHSDGGAYWEMRQVVGEATVEGRETVNLLMGLKADGAASMEGAVVSYEYKGDSYRVETTNRFRARKQCGGDD
ncbi:hypothetical protein [Streptomyces sp. XC 2026]|uniref:hypothetical protein n=1 Tax=Streptomyces sp. XC 2026 TaxID=2782004 RepID=UPI001904746E|nr:hypothetical protein [Streptomyces sp. XC 2026]QQN77148.1 hypothetical protein IPZ77_06570 [Streptomyces sp. XC 2026]